MIQNGHFNEINGVNGQCKTYTPRGTANGVCTSCGLSREAHDTAEVEDDVAHAAAEVEGDVEKSSRYIHIERNVVIRI